MSESIVMLELRKIREENSLRHAKMTPEELDNDLKASMDWFLSVIGKPVNIVTPPSHTPSIKSCME